MTRIDYYWKIKSKEQINKFRPKTTNKNLKKLHHRMIIYKNLCELFYMLPESFPQTN